MVFSEGQHCLLIVDGRQARAGKRARGAVALGSGQHGIEAAILEAQVYRVAGEARGLCQRAIHSRRRILADRDVVFTQRADDIVPVDAGEELVRQVHFDDLRLDQHLRRSVARDHGEELLDHLMLALGGVHRQQTGLAVQYKITGGRRTTAADGGTVRHRRCAGCYARTTAAGRARHRAAFRSGRGIIIENLGNRCLERRPQVAVRLRGDAAARAAGTNRSRPGAGRTARAAARA